MRYHGRHHFIILALALVIPFIGNCRVDTGRPPMERDGKLYGVTKGTFHHKWWNYYERGRSFMEGRFWTEAEADFRDAIKQKAVDDARARTMGLHFIEYYPHRELGISLLRQKRYREAVRELGTSLETEKTAKAEYFLDQARKALIERENSDLEEPSISIIEPSVGVTNRFSVAVRGIAKDDQFVKEITVNGESFRIDVSRPTIPFELSVPIRLGENRITVEAVDLMGKRTAETRKINCDRTGPILVIDGIAEGAEGGGRFRLRGSAYDPSGIRSIRIDGREMLQATVGDFDIDHPFISLPGKETIRIFTEDALGNRNQAEIRISEYLTAGLPTDRYDFSHYALPAENRRRPLRWGEPRLQRYLQRGAERWPGTNCLAALASDRAGSLPTATLTAGVPWIAMEAQGKRGMPLYTGGSRRRGNDPYPSLGNYYALIVGINDYQKWPRLKTAVNDAVALKEILVRKYGFPEENIILLTDASANREHLYYDISRFLQGGLQEKDNLLIYFAGHGELKEKETLDGYWVPVDGALDRYWSWIAHSSVKNILASPETRAKNVLLVVDSCYGGHMLTADESYPSGLKHETILELAAKHSRQIITSGGKEPVADWGKEGHSLFAYHLLKALEENEQPLIDLKTLFLTRIRGPVLELGRQDPQIGRVRSDSDDGGEFVLALSSHRPPQPSLKPANLLIPQLSPTVRGGDGSGPGGGGSSIRATDRTRQTHPPEIRLNRKEDKQFTYLDRAFLDGVVKDDDDRIEQVIFMDKNILRRPGKAAYFAEFVELKEGGNLFFIEAVDQAGNRVRKEIHLFRKKTEVDRDEARLSILEADFQKNGDPAGFDVADYFYEYLAERRRVNVEPKKADTTIEGKVNVVKGSIEIDVKIRSALTEKTIADVDVFDEFGEKLDRVGLGDLCKGLVIKLEDELPLVRGKVAAVKKKDARVIVNRGRRDGLKDGFPVILYRRGEEVRDEETGEVLIEGEVEVLGTGTISDCKEKASYVDLDEAGTVSDMEKGIEFITK